LPLTPPPRPLPRHLRAPRTRTAVLSRATPALVPDAGPWPSLDDIRSQDDGADPSSVSQVASRDGGAANKNKSSSSPPHPAAACASLLPHGNPLEYQRAKLLRKMKVSANAASLCERARPREHQSGSSHVLDRSRVSPRRSRKLSLATSKTWLTSENDTRGRHLSAPHSRLRKPCPRSSTPPNDVWAGGEASGEDPTSACAKDGPDCNPVAWSSMCSSLHRGFDASRCQ